MCKTKKSIKIEMLELKDISKDEEMQYRLITEYTCGTIKRCVEIFGKIMFVKTQGLNMEQSNLMIFSMMSTK